MKNFIHQITEMFKAISVCMNISDKINKIDEITNTMIYDVLISNLIKIRDIEKKLPNDFKANIQDVNWSIFEYYDNEMKSKYEYKDMEIIYKILKNELPNLHFALEKYIFKNNLNNAFFS